MCVIVVVFSSNGKMWTCSGTRRITVASKRSGFPPPTFGALIWCSTTSMSCGYKSAACFASSISTLRKTVTPEGQGFNIFWFTLGCTKEMLLARARISSRQIWVHCGAPPPSICCIQYPVFSLTTSRAAATAASAELGTGWLGPRSSSSRSTGVLGHLRPPHVNASPFYPLEFIHWLLPLLPQCWRWLCHCSWDQSVAGAHGNDHMEPAGHLQELLWNHRAAFPLWPPELQHEAGHLDLRWKPGRRQSCNITQSKNRQESVVHNATEQNNNDNKKCIYNIYNIVIIFFKHLELKRFKQMLQRKLFSFTFKKSF